MQSAILTTLVSSTCFVPTIVKLLIALRIVFLLLYVLFPISNDFVDMIRRRSLRTRSIKMLILDESDEMLNKGFKEQIYDVYRYLPPAIQVRQFLAEKHKGLYGCIVFLNLGYSILLCHTI